MARQMKDSGIEWIGEIPEGWVCCKQKHVIGLINGRAYKDDEFLPEAKYRVLRVGNLFTNSTWYYSDMELEADKYCENGDLIYAWSASYGPYIWDGEKIIYHYHIWKTVLANFIDKKYAYYYLLSLGDSISSESHGSAMQHITMERMNNSYIAYPGLSEQKRIAAFLDRQGAEIDAVIERTKATIEEYKKLKQAVITEAVTKGVRGARKMKDSGIEWIGEIAEAHPLIKLKHVCQILDQYRSPVTADQRSQSGEVLYDYYGASGAIDKIDGYTIDDHVMLIGEDGANLRLRNLPLMYEVNGKAWINNHAHILKPNADTDFYYLFYALEALDINPYITGSAQPKLSQENLKNILIPMPCLDEQREIAAYIREKSAALDTLIAKKTALLTELETYKKSLIYEYVTGKKEVV